MTHDPHEAKLKRDLDRRKAEYHWNPTWQNYDRMHVAEALLRSYRRKMIPGKLCTISELEKES